MIELTEKFSEKKIMNLDKNGRFVRIPWKTAMEKYGVDKPDLRYRLEIVPVTGIVKDCGFSVFRDAVEKGGGSTRLEGGRSGKVHPQGD